VRFNAEARAEYLRFATAPPAEWSGNFRELSASITRMATLADGGRITQDGVREEIQRLQAAWQPQDNDDPEELLAADVSSRLDLFDRLQLQAVVQVCRRSRSMAEAGRALFASSRNQRRTINDSDRLRKYLARFQLSWADVSGTTTTTTS